MYTYSRLVDYTNCPHLYSVTRQLVMGVHREVSQEVMDFCNKYHIKGEHEITLNGTIEGKPFYGTPDIIKVNRNGSHTIIEIKKHKNTIDNHFDLLKHQLVIYYLLGIQNGYNITKLQWCAFDHCQVRYEGRSGGRVSKNVKSSELIDRIKYDLRDKVLENNYGLEMYDKAIETNTIPSELLYLFEIKPYFKTYDLNINTIADTVNWIKYTIKEIEREEFTKNMSPYCKHCRLNSICL
jgi:hypothetical protein